MIRVYPLPPQLVTNPYLDQLYTPMREMGIDVRRIRPRYALPPLYLSRGPRILHLHFCDEIIQRRSAWQTVVRSLAFLAGLRLLLLRGVRLVWTAHNLEPHECYHPVWAFNVYRLIGRWSSAIIAHSEAARHMLIARYGHMSACHVIPQGNYIGYYGPLRDQEQSRAELGLPAHGPILLNLGALRPYKGLEDLLTAFAQLPEETRGRLFIVGAAKDQAYAAALQHRAGCISGALVLPHFVPDPQLPLYLAAADVIVLPYRSLLTSAMLMCAMSYACPVIVPTSGPVLELVQEGQNGFLFTPGNTESLRAALARALTHPDRGQLGQAALQMARRFDWPTIAAATAAIYRQVIAQE